MFRCPNQTNPAQPNPTQPKPNQTKRGWCFNYNLDEVTHSFWHSYFLLLQPYLKPGDGPIVLVLAPTCELAVQIREECVKFGASSEIKNTVVYGGVKKHTQVRDLQSGVEILIATPGCLINS
jgi:hypothetical protein